MDVTPPTPSPSPLADPPLQTAAAPPAVARATEAAPTPPATRARRPPVGLFLFALFLTALTLHVSFDRFTPYTSEATLQAPVVGIAPNVSGTIVEVAVRDNQTVRAGDLLFRIDPQRFAAAVAQAEAGLADASQRIGASTAAMAAAEAKVSEATANYNNQLQQTGRVLELVRRQVYSRAQADTATAQLATVEASVQTALAQLAEARERLGPTDNANPQIRQALAQLERARIDLRDADVRAPVDGAVTNTVLSVGHFAAAGHRVATIVDTGSAWIVANIPENALTRVRPGDPVDIAFNVWPGAIFPGTVESIASGVTQGFGDALGGDLARVSERRRWLRETQRIPVRIGIGQVEDIPGIRVGSRASVVVITQEAGWLAPLAQLWLRTVATANFVF